MKTYDELENIIVERLSMELAKVSPLPKISEINEARSAITDTRIYVIYTGSKFTDSSQLGDFAQEETLTFEAYIQARTRDGKSGIFSVSEEAIERILKWRVPDSTERISLISFGYVDGIQNSWQYMLKFSFPRLRIMREELQDQKLIKKITTNENLLS